MISFLITEEFERCYADLPAAVKRKAERRIALFKSNPFDPALRTEKLHPKEREVWSFRIDENYRIIFRFRDARVVYFLTVGHHHWIYRYVG